MRTLQRVTFELAAVAGIALAAAAGPAEAQAKFPTKPVRIVVPSSPGSAPDILTRMFAARMSEGWGQPVVVENRPGASGTIGAAQVAKASPDGYTLLFATTGFAPSAALQRSLPYDPTKDFAGITQLVIPTGVLIVAPALGVKSVKELVALAQAKPGKVLFASGGAGGATHLSGERMRLAAGINVVHVGFKGTPEAAIEVLAGRVHYAILGMAVVLPFIKDGRLLALAVNTPQRSPILPEVPALVETLPEFRRPESTPGFLAPAGTPRPILKQISNELARILDLPDIKERLAGMGFTPAPTTPEEHDRIVREQIAILSRLVIDAGLRPK
jgi:tripartite-type tricarboxylate transporter receptor subunit TctC